MADGERSSMNIAFDVSIQDTSYVTGVERVQRSLLEAFARNDGGHRFLLISKRPVDLGIELTDRFESVAVVEHGSPYLWRERFVPPLLDRRKVDIFHSPVSATPILGKSKKIATVHELPWVERTSTTAPGEVVKRGHRVWLFLNVRYATRIVAVSERTRANILSLYPQAEDRVRVIHHGVDDRFRTLRKPPDRAAFLARFGIPDKPYLFFVGTLRRKKNLRSLVSVFGDLPEPERSSHTLVLAGIRNPWPEFEELVQSEENRGRVFLPGYVSDDDLVAFYNHASAVIYPSLFEGFGLPPIEAMACGTPVITSNGGAIPEVVGKAALTFSPERPDQLQDAILSILRDHDLAARMVRRGRRHAKKFTWDATAEAYLSLYDELAGEGAADGVAAG